MTNTEHSATSCLNLFIATCIERLVYYNLHWKALHPAFKAKLQVLKFEF